MIVYSNDNPEFKPLLRQLVELSEIKKICKSLFAEKFYFILIF